MKINRVTCFEVIVPAREGSIESRGTHKPLHKLPVGAKSGWSVQFDQLPKLIVKLDLESGVTGWGELYRNHDWSVVEEIARMLLETDIENLTLQKLPFAYSREYDGFECAIWQMLVERDIQAFIRADWQMIAGDFIEENFMGIDAGGHENPADWSLKYPTLESYKQEWLKQAREFSRTKWVEDLEGALFRVSSLRHIEISGDCALVHKHFSGNITKADGELVPVDWQTLYRCRKSEGKWKIAGFTGYLPHYLPATSKPGKQLPDGVSQHKTAGPYSPVLVVNPGNLVVISGQAAINPDGDVVGETIEEQTAYTMENCRKQLASAGCTLDDVFKVNIYMKDLEDWPRFNEVYKTYFSDPLPVRAAVQTGLLLTLLVEIEMWAVKS
ncbi:MAG: hypothetical protein JJU13_04065 [Balneolaceae bacterium]|nr:hypothetical protein [Balneolaceae bacterium]